MKNQSIYRCKVAINENLTDDRFRELDSQNLSHFYRDNDISALSKFYDDYSEDKMKLYGVEGYDRLKYVQPVPQPVPEIVPGEDIFEAIRKSDIFPCALFIGLIRSKINGTILSSLWIHHIKIQQYEQISKK